MRERAGGDAALRAGGGGEEEREEGEEEGEEKGDERKGRWGCGSEDRGEEERAAHAPDDQCKSYN